MKSFLFDVHCFASLRVNAETEMEARRMIAETVEVCDLNFTTESGEAITGEMSIDADGGVMGCMEALDLIDVADE